MSQRKANTKGEASNRLDRLLPRVRRPTRPQVEDNVAKPPRVRPAFHLRSARGRAKRRVENKKDKGPTANQEPPRTVDLNPAPSAGREKRGVERRKARKVLPPLAHNNAGQTADYTERLRSN